MARLHSDGAISNSIKAWQSQSNFVQHGANFTRSTTGALKQRTNSLLTFSRRGTDTSIISGRSMMRSKEPSAMTRAITLHCVG